MMLASVSKLKFYEGDVVFDRVMAEFEAAQDEGLTTLDIDVNRLEDETRMDFMTALEDLGYQVAYSPEEQVLEIWFE